MVSLVIYIASFVIIIAIVGTITTFFNHNIRNLGNSESISSEYNKFNLYMLEYTKNDYEIPKYSEDFVTFTKEGKSDTFVKKGNGLYFNQIKLCDKIDEISFKISKAENEKNVLQTYLKIDGTVYTTDYVLENNNLIPTEKPNPTDPKAPVIKLEVNENTTWAQNSNVTVTLEDRESGLATEASVKYGWSTSTTTEPSQYTEAIINNYTSGAPSTTFTATATGLTGKYYLWVVPVNLQNLNGIRQTEIVKSTGMFYLDNTPPTIEYSEKIMANLNTVVDEAYLKNMNQISDETGQVTVTDIQVQNSQNVAVGHTLDTYDTYAITYQLKDEAGNTRSVNQTVVTQPVGSKTLTNVLENPGFESELRNYYNQYAYRSSTIKRTGNYSMYFTCSNTQAFLRIKYGNIGAKDKKVYFRAYAQTDHESLNPGVYIFEAQTNAEWGVTSERINGFRFLGDIGISTYQKWARWSALTEPANPSYDYLILQVAQGNLGTGNVYWDDFMAIVLDDTWEVTPTQNWLDEMIPDFEGTRTINW